MIRKVLVASDGSENALRAAKLACDLVSLSPEIKLTVLVVNDMIEKMKYYSPLRSPVIFEEVELFFKDHSQDVLNKTLETIKSNSYEAEGIVKVGNPAQDIVEHAADGNFDMIVIGSRGLGSLKGIILGSVSSKVIQMASCPVVIVK